MRSMSESHWWYLFYKEVKSSDYTYQPRLEFDNYKTRLKSGIFECISWLNGSLFGVMIEVIWMRVETYQMAPISPL
jgi:hypothetical protein